MKRKIVELIAFILFISSIGVIWGTAGSVDLERITLEQAIVRLIPGTIVLGLDTYLINYLTRGGEWVE